MSSVLLDTTYCNRLVRIGRGGTSGTCFLFASTNAEEASEYAALMTIPTVKRRSAIGKMGMIMAASLFITFGCAGAEKLVPYASMLKSAIANSEITAATLRFRKRSRPLTYGTAYIWRYYISHVGDFDDVIAFFKWWHRKGWCVTIINALAPQMKLTPT